MIRYFALPLCLGLMGYQNGTTSLSVPAQPSPQTACEEHDRENFKAPPKRIFLPPNNGVFDISPEHARIGFYFKEWYNAPKRVIRGRTGDGAVWQYSWSETDDYCLFHINYVHLKAVFKPDSDILKTNINFGIIDTLQRENLQALGKNYEVLHATFIKNGATNYCSQFRAYWRDENKYDDLWQNMASGWLCTSRHRTMPPDALKILLTHIIDKSAEEGVPLPQEIVRMPTPGKVP